MLTKHNQLKQGLNKKSLFYTSNSNDIITMY